MQPLSPWFPFKTQIKTKTRKLTHSLVSPKKLEPSHCSSLSTSAANSYVSSCDYVKRSAKALRRHLHRRHDGTTCLFLFFERVDAGIAWRPHLGQGILEVSFISPLSSLRDSRILKSFFENVFDASINRRFNVFANQTSKGDIEVQTD